MIIDKNGSLFEDRRKEDRRKKNIPVEVERRKGSDRRKESATKKK